MKNKKKSWILSGDSIFFFKEKKKKEKKKDGSNSIESNLNGKFLSTPKVRGNDTLSTHIHGGPYHEIIRKTSP